MMPILILQTYPLFPSPSPSTYPRSSALRSPSAYLSPCRSNSMHSKRLLECASIHFRAEIVWQETFLSKALSAYDLRFSFSKTGKVWVLDLGNISANGGTSENTSVKYRQQLFCSSDTSSDIRRHILTNYIHCIAQRRHISSSVSRPRPSRDISNNTFHVIAPGKYNALDDYLLV